MKFSVKSAGQYSNALASLINEFSTIYTTRDEYAGLVKTTEIHEKSKVVVGEMGKIYEDETKEVKSSIPFYRTDPNVRIKILEDLISEKNKIDAKINNVKAGLTLLSPISNETVTVDFAKKENSLYKNCLAQTYSSCMNAKAEDTEKEGSFNIPVDGKEMVFRYPIIVKKELLIDTKELHRKFMDLKEKLQRESDEIDRLQANTTFDFDNKFSIFESVESLIDKYTVED